MIIQVCEFQQVPVIRFRPSLIRFRTPGVRVWVRQRNREAFTVSDVDGHLPRLLFYDGISSVDKLQHPLRHRFTSGLRKAGTDAFQAYEAIGE